MRKIGHTPMRKEHITLAYSTVYQVAKMLLIDKIEPRAVAKELRLSPRMVLDLRDAKSHRAHWVDAIAELAKAGLLDG